MTDTVSLVVTPAPLAITGASTNRLYGQASPVFTGTIIGVTNGDDITTTFSCNATAASPVGVYEIVPDAAVGTTLTNYAVTYVEGTLIVNPAALTITANNQTKTYHQSITFGGTEFTIAGLLNNDTVNSVTLTSPGAPAAATASGSPYPIIPSAAQGFGLANYIITYMDGMLTVNQSIVQIIWANPVPITYGAALTTNQLNATANVPGTFNYFPTNDTVLDTGTNTLSVIFTPDDAADYTISTDLVSLVVLPAPLTVSASNFTRSFGAANPIFTGNLTGLTNGDDITATYTCVLPRPPTPLAPIPSPPPFPTPIAASPTTQLQSLAAT